MFTCYAGSNFEIYFQSALLTKLDACVENCEHFDKIFKIFFKTACNWCFCGNLPTTTFAENVVLPKCCIPAHLCRFVASFGFSVWRKLESFLNSALCLASWKQTLKSKLRKRLGSHCEEFLNRIYLYGSIFLHDVLGVETFVEAVSTNQTSLACLRQHNLRRLDRDYFSSYSCDSFPVQPFFLTLSRSKTALVSMVSTHFLSGTSSFSLEKRRCE